MSDEIVPRETDTDRFIAWAKDPERKPPDLAFTSGPLRFVADLLEATGFLPEAEDMQRHDRIQFKLAQAERQRDWALKSLDRIARCSRDKQDAMQCAQKAIGDIARIRWQAENQPEDPRNLDVTPS